MNSVLFTWQLWWKCITPLMYYLWELFYFFLFCGTLVCFGALAFPICFACCVTFYIIENRYSFVSGEVFILNKVVLT